MQKEEKLKATDSHSYTQKRHLSHSFFVAILTLYIKGMKTFIRYLLLIILLQLGATAGAQDATSNPFSKFVGEWTLKNDNWTQNWGGTTEHIKIAGHHTVYRTLNTNHSILSVIDGPPPHGHIFWTYNPVTKTVHHLSSFGEVRIGTGQGTVNTNGDVSLRLSFEGEAKGTYRLYSYKWVTADEYEMHSVQYDSSGKATGLLYGGVFVRRNNK